MKSDLIDLQIEIIHETEKGILVTDGKTTVWLPKSAIEVERDSKRPRFATITLPESLATDKELT